MMVILAADTSITSKNFYQSIGATSQEAVIKLAVRRT
jgi:hypothetical protein